jgi:hypothetical protein
MADQEIEETSTQDDLAAAWDEHEQEEAETLESAPTEELPSDQEVQQTAESAEEPEQAESGEPDVQADPAVQPEADTGDNKPEAAKGDEIAAPVSLPATAREEWANTPPIMQKAIAKRERDYAVGIQKYAENAKRAEQMDSALEPYKQYFAMNGGDPAAQINGLLQTASSLQMGNAQQQAQTIAGLVQQFGVDINALDQALSTAIGSSAPQQAVAGQQQGPGVGQQPTPDYVQRQVDAALAPYMQQQQAQQQQAQQSAAYEVEQFSQNPKNEFYREVRMDMADLMDLASNRGIQMSMQEAYDKACALSPEVQKVLEMRTSRQVVEQKQEAATSIPPGGQGGPGVVTSPDDMRGALEFAWENTGRT